MRGGGEDTAWAHFDFFMPGFLPFKGPPSCLLRWDLLGGHGQLLMLGRHVGNGVAHVSPPNGAPDEGLCCQQGGLLLAHSLAYPEETWNQSSILSNGSCCFILKGGGQSLPVTHQMASSSPRAVLTPPPALSTPGRQNVWQKHPEATVYCVPFLLVGKNTPRWWKIDSKAMRQRRLFFQELTRGTGRFSPLTWLEVTQVNPPPLREEHRLLHPQVFSPHAVKAHECGGCAF